MHDGQVIQPNSEGGFVRLLLRGAGSCASSAGNTHITNHMGLSVGAHHDPTPLTVEQVKSVSDWPYGQK